MKSKSLLKSPSNVLPYYLIQVNFPINSLNFHWRWKWWDQIQAILLNLFYFTIAKPSAFPISIELFHNLLCVSLLFPKKNSSKKIVKYLGKAIYFSDRILLWFCLFCISFFKKESFDNFIDTSYVIVYLTKKNYSKACRWQRFYDLIFFKFR